MHNYTGGNPRLLELCLATYQTGKSLADLLGELPQTPALQAVFERLWRRLDVAERDLLQSLSVFQGAAPADAWESSQALTQLIERRLVQRDQQGGLTLLPALRELIYVELDAERRAKFHREAAHIRAVRGEYTAAAFHYCQCGDPEAAIELWFAHRERETRLGQAGFALAAFQPIPLHSVGSETRQKLGLLRSELYKLTGEAAKALQDLEAVEWPAEDEKTVDAALVWGDALNKLGQPNAALERFDEGIAVVARLLNKRVEILCQSSRVHLGQREMEASWQLARQAHYEAENLLGTVQTAWGHYAEAQAHYLSALAAAEEIHDVDGIARTHDSLAKIAARRADVETATAHWEKATTYYQRTGDMFNLQAIRVNLSALYVQAKKFQEAIQSGGPAMAFLSKGIFRFKSALARPTWQKLITKPEIWSMPGSTRSGYWSKRNVVTYPMRSIS